MTAAMKKMDDQFKAADVNGDGRLNQDESNAFFIAMKEADESEGKFNSMYEDG